MFANTLDQNAVYTHDADSTVSVIFTGMAAFPRNDFL